VGQYWTVPTDGRRSRKVAQQLVVGDFRQSKPLELKASGAGLMYMYVYVCMCQGGVMSADHP
jgi:hypothetical protein